MSQATTDKPSRERQWNILLLAVLCVAIIVGIPLGYVAFVRTWLEWTLWAVPVAVGIVTFVMGVPFLMWNASATTKKKTLATAAVWGLVYLALLLVGKPFWFAAKGLLSWTVAIVALVITLRIWGKGGAQSTE
jgi:hypothetical protein